MISVVIISKDEPALGATLTAVSSQAAGLAELCEILVVDASDGRLDHIRRQHPAVRWIQFERPAGVAVTIPHQRNAGVRAARGEIIAFTDAGCEPASGWLERLIAPLRDQGEDIATGLILASAGSPELYEGVARHVQEARYLPECPSGNTAFRRAAFDAVGGFDEGFAYGSDIDFSWRLAGAGYRIRSVPDAVIRHDYGTWRRQLRRSYLYGKARTRLYRKHRSRLRHVLRTDPMVIVYPVFLLGLPLTLIFPLYPLLLVIPAWRNRSHGVVKVLADHLVYGAGILVQLASR